MSRPAPWKLPPQDARCEGVDVRSAGLRRVAFGLFLVRTCVPYSRRVGPSPNEVIRWRAAETADPIALGSHDGPETLRRGS